MEQQDKPYTTRTFQIRLSVVGSCLKCDLHIRWQHEGADTENEKGIPELLLDVSSYEKTKQFHERFQQMQNDLDDEFDEEMEQ